MSLSEFLQAPGFLKSLSGCSPAEVKRSIVDRGRLWYSDHIDDNRVIAENLAKLGLPSDTPTVERVGHHILLHYYEKLLPFILSPQQMASFLQDHVEADRVLSDLEQHINNGSGVLLATGHYGGVELLAPLLLRRGLPVSAAMRFTTEELSCQAKSRAEAMAASELFSRVRFIEIGKPGTIAAVEMASVLRKHEVLLAVFDEDTSYSIPVALLGKQVRGGAGLDRILRFANAPVVTYQAFMHRCESDDKYRLELFPLEKTGRDLVVAMYRNLENVLRSSFHQWYFLHEEIPFA